MCTDNSVVAKFATTENISTGNSTVAKFASVQNEGDRLAERMIEFP